MANPRFNQGTSRLKLPNSPRKLVFRRIVQQLRNDPILSNACRFILAWEGKPEDMQEPQQSMTPALRLTPSFGPDQWAFPDGVVGTMFVAVHMDINSPDVGDMMDLWWAIQNAIYPPNTDPRDPQNPDLTPSLAFQLELTKLGAKTGLITFSQPAADDTPSDQMQHAIGEIKIEVLSYLNM